jgi:hypothetical protein
MKDIQSLVAFYQPKSKIEEDILERSRRAHTRDEIVELERAFCVYRFRIGATHNPQSITSPKQVG